MQKKITVFVLIAFILVSSLSSCKHIRPSATEESTMESLQNTSTTILISTQTPNGDKFASGITVPKDNTAPSKKMIKASVGSSGVIIYRDTIYYNVLERSAKIKYQNLNNVQNKGAELGADPLASSTSGGLFNDVEPWPFFLVDEEATSKNGGMPVFIIACDYPKNEMTDIYRIFSYNSKDNTVKVIYEEYENIQWLALYGEYIFYITNEGDKGWMIHRVKKDGTGHAEMENRDALSNNIHFIYEDKIYYSNGSRKLYSMNLDFSGSEYVMDVMTSPSPFVYNGYIYYLDNPTPMKEGGKSTFELCRRSISNTSKEETMIKGIGVGVYRNGIFYYYKYDSPDDMVYNHKIIYGYAIEIQENFVALEISSIDGPIMYSGWNEEYLVCGFVKSGQNYYIIVNIQTGKSITIPQK